MTKDLQRIRKAYLPKARKDRRAIKDKMMELFGYGDRQVNHKLKGKYALTDSEKQFLFSELKLEN